MVGMAGMVLFVFVFVAGMAGTVFVEDAAAAVLATGTDSN